MPVNHPLANAIGSFGQRDVLADHPERPDVAFAPTFRLWGWITAVKDES